MIFLLGHLQISADTSSVASAMQSVVTPLMTTLIVIAGLISVLFLIIGGINYMGSSGKPESLAHAKKVIRNSLIGLVMVLAAATLTAILAHAYSGSSGNVAQAVPQLNAIKPASTSFSLTDLIIKAIVGVLNNIIQSVAAPFIK